MRAIEILGTTPRTALLTHFDPSFVVVIDVDWVCRDDVPIVAGELRAFAIHSPTHTFLEHANPQLDPVGERFEFVLHGSLDGDRWRFVTGMRANRLPSA